MGLERGKLFQISNVNYNFTYFTSVHEQHKPSEGIQQNREYCTALHLTLHFLFARWKFATFTFLESAIVFFFYSTLCC